MSKYKFGFNGNGEKSDWVGIHFQNLTEEQMEHLHKAEMEFLKAGVGFDTGYDFCSKTRDWEFDWSLRGAIVKIKNDTTSKKGAIKSVAQDLIKYGAKKVSL